jgi:hypothetical protein
VSYPTSATRTRAIGLITPTVARPPARDKRSVRARSTEGQTSRSEWSRRRQSDCADDVNARHSVTQDAARTRHLLGSFSSVVDERTPPGPGAGCFSGRRTVNSLPFPFSSLRTCTTPPCSATRSRTSARSIPSPPPDQCADDYSCRQAPTTAPPLPHFPPAPTHPNPDPGIAV